MRFLLYLLWSMLSLLVIALVVVTLLLTVYQDEVESRLVHGIEKATGHDIVIEGGFGFRFNPRPTFIANQIKMANSEWSRRPWMLEVDSLQASLSLSHLLAGKINFYSLEGINPRVLIERNEQSGDINWYFPSHRIPKPLNWLAEHLSIEVAEIIDARVKIDIGDIKHELVLDSIIGKTDFFSNLIDIQVRGQLDDKSLNLGLKLDNLRNMFLREPTLIEIDGLHGATKITGHGQIEDLFRWRGHDIELDLTVPTLKEVQGWVTTYLIDTPALHATARFVQPERWDSARFDDILITSDALDGQTRITGGVKQLRGMNGIYLRGELQYPLASLMEWKGLESQTDIQIDASVTLTGNKSEALAFNVLSARLIGEGVDIRGQGGVKHLLQPTTQGIPFEGTATSASNLGLINAKQWFETDLLEGSFELKKRNGRLALENINVTSFEGRAALTGELQDIALSQLGTFIFNADLKAEDIGQINTLNKSNLPAFRQTEITAIIDMQRSNFAAREVELSLRSKGIMIHGTGDLQNLNTLHTDTARVTMKASSISDINAQFATDFPELGHFQAVGDLQGNLKNLYHINNINLSLNNEHQNISGSGRLRKLGQEMTAKLDISADIQSLSNIPPLLDSNIEAPGQVQGNGTATLTARRFDDWSLADIDVRFKGANQGKFSGKVSHFPVAADYALIADFRRISTPDLPAFSMIETLKPENIRVYVQINKKPDQKNFSFDNIDTHFSLSSGVASANIAGTVSDISEFKGLSLQIGIVSSDLHAVPYFSNLSLKENLKGTATFNITGRPDHLGISLSRVEFANTDLHGELILQNKPGRKPVLKGRLGSNNLDLLNLLHQEPRKRLFSDELLEFDWVNDLDVNISVKANHFNGLMSQLDNAILDISIKDGIFNMPNMRGTVGDGSMSVWLTIVAKTRPYNIITSLKGENISPEHINLFGDSDFIRDGEIDIDIGLGGTGNSIAEFMGNAYGKIQLELSNSQLRHRNLKLFGADLISGVFDIIDTLSNKTIYLPIECGVIHFPVVNGRAVASQGIAIKTDKTTVLGGGILDLENEQLEFIIRPKARKGLGISAGTVANIVKISGNIAKPKIAIDTSSLIKSSATIGAAIASGGWTLLAQGLLDRNIANSDVCEQTLSKPNAAFFKQIVQPFDGAETEDRQIER